MACVCRSFDPLEIRKKSVKPASTASSSRIRVSSAFLSSQACAAAKTRRRVSVVAIRSGRFSLSLWYPHRPVQAVGANVFRYGGGEHGLLLCAFSESGADFGRGDVLVEVGQHKQVCVPAWRPGQPEASEPGFAMPAGVFHSIGQRRVDLFEGKPRPSGNDKVAKKQQLGGFMPLPESEEGIGAEQKKEHVSRLQTGPKALQRVKCVVGLAVRQGRVYVARRESWLACPCQLDHGEPVFKAGMAKTALERLGSYRRNENLVEGQAGNGCTRDRDVPTMRRIEGAPKKSDAHTASYRASCMLGPLRCPSPTLLSARTWVTGRKSWPLQQ